MDRRYPSPAVVMGGAYGGRSNSPTHMQGLRSLSPQQFHQHTGQQHVKMVPAVCALTQFRFMFSRLGFEQV